MGHIQYNVPGLLAALLSALLTAGLVLTGQMVGLKIGAEEFLIVWSLMMSGFALLYDRTPLSSPWRYYLTFDTQFEARIATFGCPLLVSPLVILFFSWAIPYFSKQPLPSQSYFVAMGVVGIAVLVVAVLTAPMRRLRWNSNSFETHPRNEHALPLALPGRSRLSERSYLDEAIKSTMPDAPEAIPQHQNDDRFDPIDVAALSHSVQVYSRKSIRAGRWFWVFLIATPVFFIPCLLDALRPDGAGIVFVSGLILSVVSLSGTMLMWHDMRKYRDTSEFVEVATRMSLHVTENPQPSEYAFLRSMAIFSWAKTDRASRLLRGTVNGMQLLVLDYYTESLGHTVVALQSAVSRVPDFVLHAKRLLTSHSLWLPKKWVELPAFGDQFILAGPELEKLGNYFPPSVVKLCLPERSLVMEVKGSNFILCARPGIVSPREYPALIDLATQLATELCRGATRTNR